MGNISSDEQNALLMVLSIAKEVGVARNQNSFRGEIAFLLGCMAGRIAAEFESVPLDNAVPLATGISDFLASKFTETVLHVVRNRPANDDERKD